MLAATALHRSGHRGLQQLLRLRPRRRHRRHRRRRVQGARPPRRRSADRPADRLGRLRPRRRPRARARRARGLGGAGRRRGLHGGGLLLQRRAAAHRRHPARRGLRRRLPRAPPGDALGLRAGARQTRGRRARSSGCPRPCSSPTSSPSTTPATSCGDAAAGRTHRLDPPRRAALAGCSITALVAVAYALAFALAARRVLPLVSAGPAGAGALFAARELGRMHRRGYSHRTKGASMGGISAHLPHLHGGDPGRHGHRRGRAVGRAGPSASPLDPCLVGRQGLEPWTYGLKARSSTD